MSPDRLNSVNAAVNLLAFTKLNDYPQLFTEKFYEFTGLLNALESALYADGFVKPEVWKDFRKEKSS